jgi:hypothetical protein
MAESRRGARSPVVTGMIRAPERRAWTANNSARHQLTATSPETGTLADTAREYALVCTKSRGSSLERTMVFNKIVFQMIPGSYESKSVGMLCINQHLNEM